MCVLASVCTTSVHILSPHMYPLWTITQQQRLVQSKARYESKLKNHETVSVDSCTYYSRGKSGTRNLAERQCVYMYCALYDEWLLFVYLCVCFISPLLLCEVIPYSG